MSDPSTVLHPRHKLAYFKKAGWEMSWIDEAEALVEERYLAKYATRYTDDNDNVMSSGDTTDGIQKVSDHICQLDILSTH